MAWLERFFDRDYSRDYRPRDTHRGYARDFRYRSPYQRDWNQQEARQRGERFFGGYDRGNYRPPPRPNPQRGRSMGAYDREYSSGIGYDPYYDARSERGEHDFERGNRRLREYDRGFRGGRPGYDRYF